MKTRTFVIATGLVVVLVAVLALVPAAFAQGPGGGGMGPHHGNGPRIGGPMGGMPGCAGYGGSLHAVAAEQLDMDPSELLSELQDGKSIADVAEEQGVDVDTIVDAAVAQRAEHLDEAVDAGRLTQEQADTMLELMRERITDHINGEWTPMNGNGTFRRGGPGGRFGR